MRQLNCFYLLIIGFDEIVSNKYMPVVCKAITEGFISGYSIIDLDGQQSEIKKRVSKQVKQPDSIVYLKHNNANSGVEIDREYFDILFETEFNKYTELKVYIATEVKYHFFYLEYFLKKGKSVLIEKPILCPVNKGVFRLEDISRQVSMIQQYLNSNSMINSVMCSSRYHSIFSDIVYNELLRVATFLQAPITSLHIGLCGGVWNSINEFSSREDHPYKYGYGMLMHGAYHYVDMVLQLIMVNMRVFPLERFVLEVSSFAAYPRDQMNRITDNVSALIDDSSKQILADYEYGETDIVSVFRLKKVNDNTTVTLGTLSLEQTTPSVRNWVALPDGQYNKNGRVSVLDVSASISTAYRIAMQCYDIPDKELQTVDCFRTNCHVISHCNKSLVPNSDYFNEQYIDDIHHSESNKKVLYLWLKNEKNNSSLNSHLLTMKLIEVLALSIRDNNKLYRMELPLWDEKRQYE